MPSLHCICYQSSAVAMISDSGLAALLQASRDFNATVGVTGVLLHDDGNFFQYFEGPPAGTSAVYERIRRSGHHHSIFELLNEPIAARSFPEWRMGSTYASAQTLLSLRSASWRELQKRVAASGDASPGIVLLRSFLTTARVAI